MAWTISLWYKPTLTASSYRVLACNRESGEAHLVVSTDGSLGFYKNAEFVSFGRILEIDVQYHISIAFNGTVTCIYLDGQQIATVSNYCSTVINRIGNYKTALYPFRDLYPSNTLYPRGDEAAISWPALGVIDDVRMYSRLLPLSEIIILAQGSLFSKNYLKSDYKLDHAASDDWISDSIDKPYYREDWRKIWNSILPVTSALTVSIAGMVSGEYQQYAIALNTAGLWPSSAVAVNYRSAIEAYRYALFNSPGIISAEKSGVDIYIGGTKPSLTFRLADIRIAQLAIESAVTETTGQKVLVVSNTYTLAQMNLAIVTANAYADGIVSALEQEQIDMAAAAVAALTPRYRGTVASVSSTRTISIVSGPIIGAVDCNQGDWVLFTPTTPWTQGACYEWNSAAWAALTPQINHIEKYQAAFTDILSIAGYTLPAGSFSLLFCQMIMAKTASIDEISTKVITLASAGKIISGAGNYGSLDTPVYIGADGRVSFKDKLKWDGTTLEITGAVNATSGSFSGAVNATGGLFTGLITSRQGFILDSNVSTSPYVRFTYAGLEIYSRKSAYTSPVEGDVYSELKAGEIKFFKYTSGSYESQTTISTDRLYSYRQVQAQSFLTNSNTIVWYGTTWQNVLYDSFYNDNACATGFIVFPNGASTLQIFFRISYSNGVSGLVLDVLSNPAGLIVSDYVSLISNKLQCKKLASASPHGVIYWTKTN